MEIQASIDTEPIDESLEMVFLTMIQHGEFASAIDFLQSIENKYIPGSPKIIQSVLFEILMKCEDCRVLSAAKTYFLNLIRVYPPLDEKSRKYFIESVCETQGYLSDLWNVYCHIVNSYFCYHQIYVISKEDLNPTIVKYPNCNFLLEFYNSLILKDFQHVSSEDYKECILVKLLFPAGELSNYNRVQTLLKWINDIFKTPGVYERANLLKCLLDLLKATVECIIFKQYELDEVSAFNHSALNDIAEHITDICKDSLLNLHTNAKMLITSLPLKCLQARVSERVIRLIFKYSLRFFKALTLKEIVNIYMFCEKPFKRSASVPFKQKNLRKKTSHEKIVGTTELHDLCSKNKFADLIYALKNYPEYLNSRDNSGLTPLNLACTLDYRMCVKVLINESGKNDIPKLDATIPDLKGLTPLHTAVKLNSYHIAMMLLSYGGSDLLNFEDAKGRTPQDFSKNPQITKLLLEFHAENSESDTAYQDLKVPSLRNYKEYGIYLHALNSFLCNYTYIFQLYNAASSVYDHDDKACCHFNGKAPCSEDIIFLRQLPNLINSFISLIKSETLKLNINIDLELIPLQSYIASVKCSKIFM